MGFLYLDVPMSNRQYGLGSFSQYGPTLWNRVLLAIRTFPTGTLFKTKLKIHLFKFLCDVLMLSDCISCMHFCLKFYIVFCHFVKRFDQMCKGAIVSAVYVCMYRTGATLFKSNHFVFICKYQYINFITNMGDNMDVIGGNCYSRCNLMIINCIIDGLFLQRVGIYACHGPSVPNTCPYPELFTTAISLKVIYIRT